MREDLPDHGGIVQGPRDHLQSRAFPHAAKMLRGAISMGTEDVTTHAAKFGFAVSGSRTRVRDWNPPTLPRREWALEEAGSRVGPGRGEEGGPESPCASGLRFFNLRRVS